VPAVVSMWRWFEPYVVVSIVYGVWELDLHNSNQEWTRCLFHGAGCRAVGRLVMCWAQILLYAVLLVVFDYFYPYIILCTQRGCYKLRLLHSNSVRPMNLRCLWYLLIVIDTQAWEAPFRRFVLLEVAHVSVNLWEDKGSIVREANFSSTHRLYRGRTAAIDSCKHWPQTLQNLLYKHQSNCI